MLGNRSPQGDIFDVGNVYPLKLEPSSFHAQLAKAAPTLFRDEDFAGLYSANKGRPSVPPSQLALLLLLQVYHGCSDAETIMFTATELRWCAVLGRCAGRQLCAKSTFQLFRAQLVLNESYGLLLKSSLDQARARGLLKGNEIKAALDTKPILGRGAVQDTFNLLATGMTELARAIASEHKMELPKFLARHDLKLLAAPSVKGDADIDWSDKAAQDEFLGGLVDHAHRLMKLADGGNPRIKAAGELLEQLMLQDIEEHPDGAGKVRIKKGTAKGRIPSATDPAQRHGRKSARNRFTGSKCSISADVETGLILSTEVLSGDSPDATGALELVERAEANSGMTITTVLADCAYGSGATRREFEDAGRELLAKVPSAAAGEFFPKQAFRIELPMAGAELEETKVTCPAGHVAGWLDVDKDNGVTFYFDDHCGGCALRALCTSSPQGRSLRIHPQEPLLQAARKLQETTDGRAMLRLRLIVENALARLSHLGISQARYIGHEKTRFQLTAAATVANLRRTWNWAATQSG